MMRAIPQVLPPRSHHRVVSPLSRFPQQFALPSSTELMSRAVFITFRQAKEERVRRIGEQQQADRIRTCPRLLLLFISLPLHG